MVMVEAMAEGTPVVALNRGAVPELIRPGITGLICDDVSQLPDALHEATSIDPNACIRHVRETFSADLMASRYERVYRSVIRATMTPESPALAGMNPSTGNGSTRAA